MSKVFIVRFSRYSIYKVQSLAALAVSLAILSHSNSFVKYFFQVFSTFFKELFVCFVCDPALADSFDIIPDTSSFVKHFFQNSSNFLSNVKNRKRGPRKALFHISFISFCVINQAIAAIVSAVHYRERAAIVFIAERKEVMAQQIHL